ncbi:MULTISPECIES: ABC transporter substrate-binding protein [unclassified Maridesulfovibrio]|uniref:ABC transporter substrate-binding protein n=1 Tax=unclassified Maridesulfovibrio TaxID=2794999 RepID=UPI003B3FFAA1
MQGLFFCPSLQDPIISLLPLFPNTVISVIYLGKIHTQNRIYALKKELPLGLTSCLSKFAICILTILVGSMLCGTPTASAKKLDKVTLQLKWFHQFQFAGYYAALEKGFYEEEGLDVSIIERDLRHNPIDQVLNGDSEFGISNSEVLLHYLKGKNVVLLASVFQHSPLVFISKTQPLIHSAQDLKNKNVLMSSASQDIELKVLMERNGVSLNDVKLVDRFATPEDYFDPSIDIITAYITNQPYYLKKENVPYSIIYPYTHGVDFYGDTLFTSRNQIQKYPERVSKFMRASLKGWQYALEHPGELVDIISDKFGSLKSKDHLKYEADTIRTLILPNLVRIGHNNPVRWELIGAEFKQQGMVDQTKDLSNFFFNPAEGQVTIRHETALIAAVIFAATMIVLFASIFIAGKFKQEINNRLEIEEKLKKSEKYYRSLFDNTGAATVIIDQKHTIIKCNENFAQLCGSTVEDIESKQKWTDFIAPEEYERMTSYASTRFSANQSPPKSYDFKFLRTDGEIRNVHVDVGVIEGSTDCVASIIDMTEKVKTQELLIQTEKIVSVGGLAAGMAHEINNPLAGILQAVQNIYRRISPNVPANTDVAEKIGCSCEQIQSYLEERGIIRMLDGIHSSGERAANIVHTMLNFTRRNDGGMTVCNLNKLFDDIMNIITCDYDLKKKYDFKHTTIIKDYQENLGEVNCLRIEIEQVLLNLVKNAAYATNEISDIRTPTITLRTKMDDKFIIAEVEDNGPGMSPEVKRRVFEPFFTTKSPGVGTGLGLSVSYFIITQNHKGTFDIETEIGKGTKFTIKLPIV